MPTLEKRGSQTSVDVGGGARLGATWILPSPHIHIHTSSRPEEGSQELSEEIGRGHVSSSPNFFSVRLKLTVRFESSPSPTLPLPCLLPLRVGSVCTPSPVGLTPTARTQAETPQQRLPPILSLPTWEETLNETFSPTDAPDDASPALPSPPAAGTRGGKLRLGPG